MSVWGGRIRVNSFDLFLEVCGFSNFEVQFEQTLWLREECYCKMLCSIHASEKPNYVALELQDVFKQPYKVLNERKGLPPDRQVDLRSNINPPNTRFYRYSYQQMIGIERLIQDARIEWSPCSCISRV